MEIRAVSIRRWCGCQKTEHRLSGKTSSSLEHTGAYRTKLHIVFFSVIARNILLLKPQILLMLLMNKRSSLNLSESVQKNLWAQWHNQCAVSLPSIRHAQQLWVHWLYHAGSVTIQTQWSILQFWVESPKAWAKENMKLNTRMHSDNLSLVSCMR